MPAPYPISGETYTAEFPTPQQTEKYLYKLIDARSGAALPEYGDPHEDQERHEGFRVSLVVPDKEQGIGWWIVAYSRIRDEADQNTYNYDTIYPFGDNSYPRITRTYIFDQEAYDLAGPAALGTADPGLQADGVTAMFASAIQVEPDRVESATNDPVLDALFVKVTRVFERLPGPILYESDHEPRTGHIVQTSKQVVAQSTVPTTAALLDAEMNGYSSAGAAIVSIVTGLVTTSAVHGLAIGDEVYFPSLVGESGDIIEGNAAGTGAYYVKTVPTTTTFTVSVLHPDNAAVAQATGSATSGSAPKKRALARGTIVEYKPLGGTDKYRSVRIVSSLPLAALDYLYGGADKVYKGVRNHSFPDQLADNDISWYWAEAWNSGGGWDLDFALYAKIKEGYSGPCIATITERYTTNPASAAFLASLPAITTFAPEAIILPVAYYYASTTQARAFAKSFTVPPTLHPNITIDPVGDAPTNASGGAGAFTSITATTPTVITTGTSYLVAIEAELMQFGIWVYRMFSITAPSW